MQSNNQIIADPVAVEGNVVGRTRCSCWPRRERPGPVHDLHMEGEEGKVHKAMPFLRRLLDSLSEAAPPASANDGSGLGRLLTHLPSACVK